MRKLTAVTIAALGLSAIAARPTDEGQQADAVIRVERASLDRWGNGDPEGFLGTYATDITYFDPMQPKRVDGLATMRAMYGPLAGKIHVDSYDMIDPRVQRYGDVAVLTYNLVSHVRPPQGQARDVRWNSTAVFHREHGKWREIHSHWSFTGSPQANPETP